jgi:hypothetical protein
VDRGWAAFLDLVIPSENNILSHPLPHQRGPWSREECYCGFSLQEASIMVLFMALTAKNYH